MKLSPICEMTMHYTWIDFVDYGASAASTWGPWRARSRATGCAARSNPSTSLRGIALLRPEDNAWVFTTSLSLRTGDARYTWVNNTIGAVEGILNTTTEQALIRASACENELATVPV